MKTDYTITPEYREAVQVCQQLGMAALHRYAAEQNICGRETPEQIAYLQKAGMHDDRPLTSLQMAGMQNASPWASRQWEHAYEEARRSHAAGEPLIRTVCKIATRILLVLLIVGIAVGVMAA